MTLIKYHVRLSIYSLTEKQNMEMVEIKIISHDNFKMLWLGVLSSNVTVGETKASYQ